MKLDDEYRHFITIVAGDDPEKQMEKYDMTRKMPDYHIVYKFSDASDIKQNYLDMYGALLKNTDLNSVELKDIVEQMKDITLMSSTEFFMDLTSEYEYDPETGDAISNENPDGKWLSYSSNDTFASPFILKNGDTSFSALKKDIDWPMIHMNNTDIYNAAWEMVMEHRKPSNDEERTIYENMKNRTAYFSKFHSKENYTMSSTAFWGYAFLKDGIWRELEDNMDQFEWMKNFYGDFIEPLPEDTKLTIYWCRRK